MIRAHHRSLSMLPLLVAALVLGACARPGAGDGSPPASADDASPSAAASQSTQPSSVASASAAPSEDLGPFSCAFPIEERGTPVHAQIVDVRVGEHDGYDRVVFEFEDGIPEFVLSQAEAPYTEDPSGNPIEVSGDAVLQLVMIGGTSISPDYEQTYTGPFEFDPGFSKLVHLVEAGDFEAVSSWYIGLAGDSCARVLTLDGPDRLVIDIEH